MADGALYGISFTMILGIIIIAIVAIAVERLGTRYLSRFAKRVKLRPNATNNLVLFFRILVLIGAVLVITRVGGLQPEWIIAISTIAGAALGFASQKTLGNFVAGLFLLAARPFKVGDYVRLGTTEGIVQEITINYTRILTIGNNTVSVSNIQILDRDITNYTLESAKNYSLHCYTFELGFDHSIPTEKITEIFNDVFERIGRTLPKKPALALNRSDAFGRVYTIYLYVEHPEDVFTLKTQIAEEVFKRWDFERMQQKQTGPNNNANMQNEVKENKKAKENVE